MQAQLRFMEFHVERLGIPIYPTCFPDTTEGGKLIPLGAFVDQDQSAYCTPFLDRPAGKAVMELLQPGDSLFVLRIDRICRTMKDFCHVLAEFERRKIRLIICNPLLDLGTADGRACAHVLAAIAEWESAKKGERIRAANAARRRQKEGPLKSRELGEMTKIVEQMDSTWRPRPKPEPSKAVTGRIHTYVRCSSRDSADSGLGLMAQSECHARYVKHLLLNNPNLVVGEEVFDIVQSAYSRQFRNRPGGKHLDEIVKAGDIVVIHCVDRGFRDTRDMVNLIPEWLARGVDIHFSLDGQKMSDPMGRMLATILVQFAETESALTSVRTKEAKAIAAQSGRYLGAKVPLFWKVFTRRNQEGVWHKMLMLDRERICQFRLIMLYVNVYKMSRPKALDRLEELIAARQGRPPIPEGGVKASSKLGQILLRVPGCPEPTSTGTIYRDWTKLPLIRAIERYDDAIAEWRRIAAERRERQA